MTGPGPTMDLPPGESAAALAQLLARQADAQGRIAIDPDRVEQDLARLVLALLEFLRELMELQAIRRVESGSLTEAEEERLGTALLRARERIRELAAAFGLEEDALSLDLGPLGQLT
jgi:hypothetical protein